ncbi:ESX secretion-associated protein EspG [Nocardia sp. CDC159]|uniref:ESX secretion-associated protein EspG n=1 Tax=Nocardia pulmonis TaxID=2951408 RepID=A0A9X2EBQ0_9NOCA|nr:MULTISPECIES: ESX secretion-associated protein EspG [Nocardia]MCM6777974.1 ESX secretion-associated protein EspG [Nocardia pulmonis]MCM6790855.1 ESX secretion-associated protein EspG [Nocardia sp. CDC159]
MKWEFTPDEFMHVWKETDRDRYPFPLSLYSSTAWQSEAERLARELDDRLPRGGDPDLSAVLRVAANPDVALSITGSRKRPVRVYAAIDTTVGVTLVQRPGPRDEVGGNVVIEVGSPAIVPKVFLAVLGSTPAGRYPAMVESFDRIQLDLESWTGTRETVTDRMRRLLQLPRTAIGHLEARQALHTSRPHPPRYLSWIDIENDGRYLYYQQHNDLHIEPCSPDRLHREITRLSQPVPTD